MEVTVRDKPAAAQLPWKTRVAISVVSGMTDATRRSNGTVNRWLLSLLDLKALPNPNPIKGVKSSDVIINPSRNLWFRLFVPVSASTSTKLPVMVFFHGGGFVYLSADNRAYDLVCRRFALKLPAIVISVNYRLAPEHPYPAQYDDGFDVLNFLNQHASNNLPENADLSSCFLAGDSAGANIAHHVAKRVCEAQAVLPNIKVKGVVAIQPFFGGEERTESEKRLVNSHLVSVDRTDWMWTAFMGGAGNRDHEAINVSGPRSADISALDFPPTMVVVGGLDPLQDWQRNYYNWLTTSGKKAYLLEYPNVIHAFYLFPELPDSSRLIAQVTYFIHNLSIN